MSSHSLLGLWTVFFLFTPCVFLFPVFILLLIKTMTSLIFSNVKSSKTKALNTLHWCIVADFSSKKKKSKTKTDSKPPRLLLQSSHQRPHCSRQRPPGYVFACVCVFGQWICHSSHGKRIRGEQTPLWKWSPPGHGDGFPRWSVSRWACRHSLLSAGRPRSACVASSWDTRTYERPGQ